MGYRIDVVRLTVAAALLMMGCAGTPPARPRAIAPQPLLAPDGSPTNIRWDWAVAVVAKVKARQEEAERYFNSMRPVPDDWPGLKEMPLPKIVAGIEELSARLTPDGKRIQFAAYLGYAPAWMEPGNEEPVPTTSVLPMPGATFLDVVQRLCEELGYRPKLHGRQILLLVMDLRLLGSELHRLPLRERGFGKVAPALPLTSQDIQCALAVCYWLQGWNGTPEIRSVCAAAGSLPWYETINGRTGVRAYDAATQKVEIFAQPGFIPAIERIVEVINDQGPDG